MNRRAPVRSVLAERRMFSNGGMLPISTPFQNTPSGILASSSPLIETVSQEILAPLTGGPMPMAEGGVAKFQDGGTQRQGSPTRIGGMSLGDIKGTVSEWLQKLTEPGETSDVTSESVEVQQIEPVSDPLASLGPLTTKDKQIFNLDLQNAINLRARTLQEIRPHGLMELARGAGFEGSLRTGQEVAAAQKEREAKQPEIDRLTNLPLSYWLDETGAGDLTQKYFRLSPESVPTVFRYPGYDVNAEEIVVDNSISSEANIPVGGHAGHGEGMDAEEVVVEDGVSYDGDSDAIPLKSVTFAAGSAAGTAGSEKEESAAKAEKEAVSDQTLLEIANAAENQNVDRDMSFFKKRFIDEVGEYEGKTEYEKGLDFLKLGMSIAAGASDNAVENISRGVLATIDEFGVDEEQKRDFNRKVKFSAVQYALSNVAREEAQGEADKRKLYFFYDQDTKTKAKPYGDLVAHSLADILDNDGKLPPNLREKDLVIKEISAVAALNKSLKEQLIDNAELWRIGRVEADNIRERLDNNETTFVSGEVAIGLLNSVLGDVAGGNITGIGNAGKELWRRAIVAAGGDPGDKFKNIEDARAKIRRAFQLLIPESLGQAQTANSISNRDVQFLADAYIDSGFLENGVFSFTTTGIDALGERLMGAMEVFKNAQFKALADYDDIIKRLNDSEEALTKSQKTGIPVDPGPFGPKYFSSALERIKPVAEKTRGIISGTQATPRLWSYEFDEDERKFRYKGAKGTVFEGQFFTPNEVNIKKLYGR